MKKTCGTCEWWRPEPQSDYGPDGWGSCPVFDDYCGEEGHHVSTRAHACPAYDDGSYGRAVEELIRQARNAALDFDQFINPAIDCGAWPNMHRFNITPRKLEEAIAAVEKAKEGKS
ncbi:MAG: hypothetical protein WC583_07060 [Candidatus Omnitrophota bacterium]|jgi:hypothetical protein